MPTATPLTQKLIGEATMHYAYGEFQQAMQLLKQVVREAPGLPHPYQTLGLIYEETGQPHKALKLFMMAAHLSKKDAMGWKNLAQMCKKHGETQQGIYCLQRVLALTPDDEDAQWERALLLSQIGEHRRAAKALLPLLRKHPSDAKVVHRLVRSYHRLGYTARALRMLDALVTPPEEDASAAAANGESSPSSANSSTAGGVTPRPSCFVDMHSLNMLLDLFIETGRFREAIAKLQLVGKATHHGDGGTESASAAAAATAMTAGNSACGQGCSEGPGGRSGGIKPPIEIVVKEGVCYAYLGEMAIAESLWQPLLTRSGRAADCADLMYEVAVTYLVFATPHLQRALSPAASRFCCILPLLVTSRPLLFFSVPLLSPTSLLSCRVFASTQRLSRSFVRSRPMCSTARRFSVALGSVSFRWGVRRRVLRRSSVPLSKIPRRMSPL